MRSNPRTLAEQKADASVGEDTLEHGETLLVVTTGDLGDVASPLGTELLQLDLVAHALVHEDAATNTMNTSSNKTNIKTHTASCRHRRQGSSAIQCAGTKS